MKLKAASMGRLIAINWAEFSKAWNVLRLDSVISSERLSFDKDE